MRRLVSCVPCLFCSPITGRTSKRTTSSPPSSQRFGLKGLRDCPLPSMRRGWTFVLQTTRRAPPMAPCKVRPGVCYELCYSLLSRNQHLSAGQADADTKRAGEKNEIATKGIECRLGLGLVHAPEEAPPFFASMPSKVPNFANLVGNAEHYHHSRELLLTPPHSLTHSPSPPLSVNLNLFPSITITPIDRRPPADTIDSRARLRQPCGLHGSQASEAPRRGSSLGRLR